MSQLSRGAIPQLYADRQSDGRFLPVLQVTDIHVLPQPSGQTLHLMVLSDGELFTSSVVTPACMDGPNPVTLHSLVQLLAWKTEEKAGKLMVFVSELRHLGIVDGQIGDPAQFAPPAQLGAVDTSNAAPAPGTGQGMRTDAELGRFLNTQPGPPAGGTSAPLANNPYAQQNVMSFQANNNPYAQQSATSLQAQPHAQQQMRQPVTAGQTAPTMQNPYQQQAGYGGAGQTAPAGGYGGVAAQTLPAGYGGVAAQTGPAGYGGAAAQTGPSGYGGVAAQTGPSGYGGAAAHTGPAGYGGAAAAIAPTAPWHHQASTAAAPPPEPSMPSMRQAPGFPNWSAPRSGSGQIQQQAPPPGNSSANASSLRRTPSFASGGGGPQVTVAGLTPYLNRWQLTARIMKKNTIRKFNYKNKEGEGQLFSIDLFDKDGGETRATFFGGAVDNFYEMLQERKTYSFSGGRIKQADKRFCRCDHEITFDENSVITPVEDDGNCPKIVYDFKPLASLEDVAVGAVIDVAAVIVEVEAPGEVNLKAGGTKQRMNVTLMDDSSATCRLTLWGEQIDKPWREGEVALLRGLKVGDFGGRSLSASFGTFFALGREAFAEGHQRAQELASWYAEHGNGARGTAKSLSNNGGGGKAAQTIAEMKAEDNSLDPSGPPGAAPPGAQTSFYHTVSPATVTFLPHERAPFYYACVHEVPDDRASSEGQSKTRACMRKTERMGDGFWCCNLDHRCQEAKARWVTNLSIADHSGSLMVSAFDESGRDLYGCDATEAARLWEAKEMDPVASEQFEQLFKDAQFKRWRLRMRSKKEVWNDEERVRAQIVECRKLNFVTDSKKMLEEVLTACGEPPNNGRPSVAAPACGG